jgi:hypothetical protein
MYKKENYMSIWYGNTVYQRDYFPLDRSYEAVPIVIELTLFT